MIYSKIITHNGSFHADETLAIATLFKALGYTLPIERKENATQEELDEPTILVLDIGRNYTPALGNFDHHQDSNSPATNILILDYFFTDEFIKDKLKQHLFQFVSDTDCGIFNKDVTGVPSFSLIIDKLNSLSRKNPDDLDENFHKALSVAQLILDGYFDTFEQSKKNKVSWDSLPKIANGFLSIDEHNDFILEPSDFQEFATADLVLLHLSPNPRGGWQIMSRSTNVLKIPAKSTQKFLHNAGFIAVYNTFNEAYEHAYEILENHFQKMR